MSPAQSVILHKESHPGQADDCLSEVNKGEALVAILYDESDCADPRVIVQFRDTVFSNPIT